MEESINAMEDDSHSLADSAHLIFASLKVQSQQFFAQLSTDYYRPQHLQFSTDPVLIVFNEKLNTHVGLTL
jgi:hypothetical protein